MNFKDLGEELGLEEDEYRELIELFMETGQSDLSQLKSALDAGDAETVSRRAHTICGSSGNLRLMDMHKTAKRIELAADDGRLDGLSVYLSALDEGFSEIARSLQG
ncbi:Hpt domain-containing protein [uncultured Desulfosarcina sp.]|uniref:Hpt domain-containing protein n=1 Tax=uncultured Desulfosarcina sp. TaxID=218289 RepID=UPI0029C9B05C|nr:Hpt domain-containing protein [uncultured Desulfosarcina sp.]